jgi:DNA polymerase (family 10)
MNNKEVAEILDEIGTLFELKGENRFKCIAFHNAARTIGALTRNLDEVVAAGELRTIKGIGEAIAENITEMVTKGKSTVHQELRKSLPPAYPTCFQDSDWLKASQAARKN